MTIRSFYVRNMLLNYDRQLVHARRLARYRRSLQAADAEDEVTISREAKRNHLVERVAREIIENLVVAGSDNPIVEEIKKLLQDRYGENLQFAYPPMDLSVDQDMQIFRETDEGPKELNGVEKGEILQQLWKLTLDKVNETML